MSGSWQKLRADAWHYARFGRGGSPVLRLLLLSHGFQFVFLNRMCEALHGVPVIGRPLRRVLWWVTCVTFGSELALAARIDGGLFIPHPFGIVIGECTIGRGATIMHNVTVGVRHHGDGGFAVIGDDVHLGAGAAIIGGISIGDGVTVGANAVVLRDVADGCTAVGNPARILRPKSGSTSTTP